MAKKLLLLGATGGTGRQVVSQSLELGHEVTAFVRDPRRFPLPTDRLHVVTGTLPEDRDLLCEAIRGHDAVISTLGVGNSLKSHGLIERSVSAILGAMGAAGVRRLVFTSAYGVGTTRGDLPLLPRLITGTLLRDLYADKAAGEVILRRSGLDWTIVYPATLTNGPRVGHYRTAEHLALRGLPRISRADVAEFLIAQVDDLTYLQKGVLISP